MRPPLRGAVVRGGEQPKYDIAAPATENDVVGGKKKHAPQKHTSDCLHEHKKTGVEDPTKKKSPGTLRNHEQLLSWLPTGGGST